MTDITIKELFDMFQLSHNLDNYDETLLNQINEIINGKIDDEYENFILTHFAGIYYICTGKPQLAEKYLLRIVDSNDVSVLNTLGKLYRSLKKYQNAEQYWLKGADEFNCADCQNNLGYLYFFNLNEPLKSEEYYLKAIQNKHLLAVYNLSSQYSKKNKYDAAITLLSQSLEWIESKQVKQLEGVYRIMQALGDIYYKLNKLDESKEFNLKALTIIEQKAFIVEVGIHHIVLLNLARINFKQKNYPESNKYYLKAISISPATRYEYNQYFTHEGHPIIERPPSWVSRSW